MPGVGQAAQRRFDVIPAPLVLETLPDQLGDERAPPAAAGAAVELGDQIVFQCNVHTHESNVADTPPAQRYVVLDERRTSADDVPNDNLMAAVIGLEQSREPTDLVRVVDALRARLREPGDAGLRRAFTDWVGRLAARLAPAGAASTPMPTLEDVRMALIERVSEWPAEWLRKGHAQGLEQGREQGLEQGREQGLEQGREQGLEQGREQGLEHERALLRRQAARKFGDAAAGRLAEALADVADPEWLEQVGVWIIECGTEADLLARVRDSSRRGH